MLSDDCIYKHVHTLNGDACGIFQFVFNGIHYAAGNSCDIYAAVNAYMKLKGNALALTDVSDNALGHGFTAEELPWAAFLAAGDHTLYTKAAGSRIACEISENVIGNADASVSVADINHKFCSFL